jgi:DNA-binding transcriptional LysR family regulator
MIPTPSELRYFIEVVQTRHLSNAAIRLAVSQPTLTQSIKNLEKKMGARLFHRTRQGTLPTEAGLVLFREAKKLLDQWEALHLGAKRTTRELRGRFRLGCSDSVGTYTLPDLLSRLQDKAPGIEVVLSHEISRKIAERVISFDLDLGIVVNPPKHPDLVLKKIGEDRMSFWKKTGIKEIPDRIFADLQLTQTKELLDQTKESIFCNHQVLDTTSFEIIRALCRRGLGIGILPARIALREPGLSEAGKSLPSFRDEIFLVYRREVLNSLAGKTLVDLASGILK